MNLYSFYILLMYEKLSNTALVLNTNFFKYKLGKWLFKIDVFYEFYFLIMSRRAWFLILPFPFKYYKKDYHKPLNYFFPLTIQFYSLIGQREIVSYNWSKREINFVTNEKKSDCIICTHWMLNMLPQLVIFVIL